MPRPAGSASLPDKRANSVITFDDGNADVAAWLAGANRRVEFDVCVQSGGGSTGPNGFMNSAASGFSVEGQRMGSTDWERIAFVNGWMYENDYTVGDAITTFFGMEAFTCTRAGGWVDWSVTIPPWAVAVRCAVENEDTGTGWGNDAALHGLTITHGGM